MKEFTYVITDEHGIHARPAGELVRELQKFTCDIRLTKEPKSADGKRLFAVMGLAVKQGETLHISCDGDDEAVAAQTTLAFLQANL